MIGEECIRPVRAKHSGWCGLASIVQAIVETFPKNCALMFPPLPPPSVASFSTTFRPQSSDDDDDNDANNYGASSSFHRFDSSLLVPALGDLGRTGCPYTSTPLLHGGAFRLSTDPKEPPSSSLGTAHSWVTTIWTWGRRPMMREMARRLQPVTRPCPTPPSSSYYRR